MLKTYDQQRRESTPSKGNFINATTGQKPLVPYNLSYTQIAPKLDAFEKL